MDDATRRFITETVRARWVDDPKTVAALTTWCEAHGCTGIRSDWPAHELPVMVFDFEDGVRVVVSEATSWDLTDLLAHVRDQHREAAPAPM